MAKQMTSAERMGLFTGEKPDRVPVNSFAMGFCAQIMGWPIGDYYADGDKCFESQMISARLFGYDSTPFYAYASSGPWEFGGHVEFPYRPATSAPYVLEHPVNSPEDAERLEVPKFKKGRLPGAYGLADQLAKRSRELGMPVIVQAGSTFTSSGNVVKTATFLRWLFKEPKTCHLILDKVSDMIINAMEYFAAEYGPENCVPFDGGPTEANTVISPEKFKEFAFPYQLKVHKRIKEMGFPGMLMHPCANQNGNMPYYIQLRRTGWWGKYFWSFGPETTIADQIAAFGAHDVILGNVDPPSFQFKSYDECLQLM